MYITNVQKKLKFSKNFYVTKNKTVEMIYKNS